ncbi:hypothetical protein CLAIMM_03556 [Cladophialophora immunda]|nr:hypothetical protein CLAIMM_03556 [Cladophialophora immunda]
MDEPSITALKAAFLRSQIRLLETPLEPSTQWRDILPEPEEGRLSDKLIQDLVAKVNEKVKQHNRLIFSTQSQRHVAEQIESLHWALAAADSERADLDTVGVRRDADLTDSELIASLPQDYDALHLHPGHEHRAEQEEGEEEGGMDDNGIRYTRMREELLSLSQQRDALKGRLAQYRHLQRLTEPLREPQVNIQPNLITRLGELEKQMGRTGVLVDRVTARLEEMGKTKRPRLEDPPKAPQTDQEKLAQVMGRDKLG